jgi:hypothetical protein
MKTRITIQVSQDGESVGEYIANVEAATETEAVDKFLQHARIDLRYRFLGRHGYIFPSAACCLVENQPSA